MIKLFLLIYSLSSFAIVPGVRSLDLEKRVIKIKFTKFAISQSGICTGTRISKREILTAAHCVKNYLNKKSKFLKLSINNKNYSIKSIKVPDKYLELQQNYDDAISQKKPFASQLKEVSRLDIAIIKVQNNIDSNILITKISKESSFRVKLCGYGYTRFVDNLFFENKSQDLFCGFNEAIYEGSYLFIKGNLANTSLEYSLTAPGDSGSPLFDSDMNQIAVLSGITINNLHDATSYYANLSKMLHFLGVKSL